MLNSFLIYSLFCFPTAEAREITITITGAVVNVAKMKENPPRPWDGMGEADIGIIGEVAALASALGYVPIPADQVRDVTNNIASVVNRYTAPPDIRGEAVLIIDGVASPPAYLTYAQDSFSSLWDHRWENVDLDRRSELQLSLWDTDLQNDDPIGMIILDHRTMKKITRMKGQVLIPTHHIDPNILYITVSIL